MSYAGRDKPYTEAELRAMARKLSGKDDLGRTGYARKLALFVVKALDMQRTSSTEMNQFGAHMEKAFKAIAEDCNVETHPFG